MCLAQNQELEGPHSTVLASSLMREERYSNHQQTRSFLMVSHASLIRDDLSKGVTVEQSPE